MANQYDTNLKLQAIADAIGNSGSSGLIQALEDIADAVAGGGGGGSSTAGLVSDNFSETDTYDLGDYCIHNNTLYVSINAITTPGAWDLSDWQATNAGIQLSSLNSAIAQMFGSGSGSANSLVFREEITEITAEMWASIADGTFSKVHTGMHYTAPSGRKYFFADADYFFGHGNTEMTDHHMLVIEDECQGTAQHQTTSVTTGGATSSMIYTTYLPAHQSELEADFGAAHILEARLLISNEVSKGSPSSWAWATKKSFLLNMPMVFGHYLQLLGANEMYNGGNRVRQAALFQAMPETIISRLAATQVRQWWWTDDVASAAAFGIVSHYGYADYYNASYAYGVRRAFIIG